MSFARLRQSRPHAPLSIARHVAGRGLFLACDITIICIKERNVVSHTYIGPVERCLQSPAGCPSGSASRRSVYAGLFRGGQIPSRSDWRHLHGGGDAHNHVARGGGCGPLNRTFHAARALPALYSCRRPAELCKSWRHCGAGRDEAARAIRRGFASARSFWWAHGRHSRAATDRLIRLNATLRYPEPLRPAP